jgi:hypothetical protein
MQPASWFNFILAAHLLTEIVSTKYWRELSYFLMPGNYVSSYSIPQSYKLTLTTQHAPAASGLRTSGVCVMFPACRLSRSDVLKAHQHLHLLRQPLIFRILQNLGDLSSKEFLVFIWISMCDTLTWWDGYRQRFWFLKEAWNFYFSSRPRPVSHTMDVWGCFPESSRM